MTAPTVTMGEEYQIALYLAQYTTWQFKILVHFTHPPCNIIVSGKAWALMTRPHYHPCTKHPDVMFFATAHILPTSSTL